MQFINLLIVEDDPKQQELMTMLLKPFDFIRVVGIVSSGEDLIKTATLNSDITAMFLDIDLGDGKDGLDSYSILRFRGIHIPAVLVTGQKPDASHTFDLDIVDVLEKPFTAFRLKQTVEKLRNYIQYQNFMKDGGFLVPIANDQIVQVPPSEILFIESINRTVVVHTKKHTIETKIPLKTYENYLKDHHFIVTHRSCLVNLRKIKGIEQCKISFKDDQRYALTAEDNEPEIIRLWTTVRKLIE